MSFFSRIFGGKRRCSACRRRRPKDQDFCPYCTAGADRIKPVSEEAASSRLPAAPSRPLAALAATEQAISARANQRELNVPAGTLRLTHLLICIERMPSQGEDFVVNLVLDNLRSPQGKTYRDEADTETKWAVSVTGAQDFSRPGRFLPMLLVTFRPSSKPDDVGHQEFSGPVARGVVVSAWSKRNVPKIPAPSKVSTQRTDVPQIVCPDCGTSMPYTAAACPKCRARMVSPVTSPSSAKKTSTLMKQETQEIHFSCKGCAQKYTLGADALVVTSLGVMADFKAVIVLGTGSSFVENRSDPDLVAPLERSWSSLDAATVNDQRAEMSRISSLLSTGRPRWWKCRKCGRDQTYELIGVSAKQRRQRP